MKHTVTVKLKPYLQEFLVCKLGDQSLEASKKNLIGAILSPLVEYAPRDYVFKKHHGEQYITFEVPQLLGNKNNRSGTLYVSQKNQREFERILGLYFKDIFFQYVDDKIRYTGQIKKCIMQFCADYNITFNRINYEMLKKSYYRKKSAQNTSLFRLNLSLACPLIFML